MVERIGQVHSWPEMAGQLQEIDPHCRRFARAYFKSQVFIVEGRPTKAKRLFRLLDKMTGFRDFEDKNEGLLRSIDIAVRGETTRRSINF